MKKIRIKNDIRVSWGITTNNQQVSLENRKLAVSLIVYNLIIPIKDFTVSGNVITFVFHGNDQYRCGVYTLVCQDSTNGEVNTIDKTEAFMLVPHSSEESGEDNENVALEVVQLSTDRSSTTIGKAATVRVGDVSSLSPDDFATVSNEGTINDAVLKFGIPRGKDGLSAYDVARLHGFEGTQQEWLDSLKPSLERVLHQINTSDVNNLIPRRGGYLYFDGASWKWEDKPRFYALDNNGSSGIGEADYDYILKQIEDRFLSRIADDSAKGTITFEEIQKFLRGFRIGNYTDQSGGQWALDNEGRSSITTDYLQVRMKAIFETLEILHTDTVGGRLVISPVGSNRILKVEEVTTTYNGIEQKAYRCYFLAEQDGAEVQNKWKVGDQARAESFNVGKGIYHHVGNHFLWRLVIGINGEVVEIDGKKYNYVDLSQIDSAPGSDVPAPDDVLNQLGNRNDTTRQSALVFSAVDNFSPSVTIYQGINTFSWYGKEYVEYGVNNGKAFFNLYGDAYIGDKDTVNPKSYLKYNSTTKKFEIKADIDIKSTFDGKELPDYIKDNTLSKDDVNTIVNGVKEDLQGQIDGAIETWFYEGKPTLDNEPAVNWKDDDTKNVHLGDLYYDKNTGMAYRFMLDSGVYKWTLIKDLDITKALADAAKAQLTADGKMTVFSEQPNPPYQEGDIWVNATYKDPKKDTYIYKDDLLRCKIGKEEGDGFDINDWQLATKYTDDTALDDFKQEYTEVMASYKKQLDGKVETWYYEYPPTTTNEPAKNWNEDEKSDHAGDLFYNTKTGYAYRWTGALWSRIKDSDITDALDAASKAQDTADHKRTNFTSKPTPPYDLGDLWTDTSDDGKILKVCVNAKKEGEIYADSDWEESNDATLNAFSKTVNKSLEGIQDQLDQKAETWYQAEDPSLAWKTSEERTLHKGDLWYDTNTGKTYYYTGSKWEQQNIPNEVFDQIDGKAEIFAGEDGPKSYHENDLWILPVKKTVNGTEYAKGEVLTAIATNLEQFNEKDWTKLVSYTDDTKANNVERAFNQFKTNEFNTLNKNYKDFSEDGVFDIAEIKALKSNITDVNNSFSRLKSVYDELIKSDFLKETVNNVADYVVDAKKLIELFEAFETAKDSYITTINNAIADGKATSYDKNAYESSYNSFTEAYDNFVNQLAKVEQLAIKNLYNEIGNDYGYLKEAYKKDTKVQGGLVLTSTIQLRDGKGSNEKVTGGINGILENGSLSSIAAWYGGPMADKDHYPGTDIPTPGTNCARSLFRHDGSGYLSSGAIHWDIEGNLHVNPLSFVLKGQDVGLYLVLFKLHLLSGIETATSLDHIDWITPQKPFSELSVLSNIVVGDGKQDSSITIGNIKITNKAGTNELAFTNVDTNEKVNIWTTGGLSAYGNGSTGSAGGGLNGSVIKYSDAILQTTANESDEVASAWSIKMLSDRIKGVAEAMPSISVDVPTTGNALTGATYDAATGKLTFTKGTFLTSHQSLAAYLKSADAKTTYAPISHAHTKADITDMPTDLGDFNNTAGYTKNKGTVTSVGLTLPTGLTLGTTKTITSSGTFAVSFTAGYSIPKDTKQKQWDSAYDWYKLMTTDEEEADGVINKWNEVVSFLANIAQADTLSGIIDGINTSISDETTRAKKAEGTNATNISNNAKSITTLKGYFDANGNAKSALKLTNKRKLWGNDFDGTDAVNGNITMQSTDGTYIQIGGIRIVYDEKNTALKVVKSDGTTAANLYATGGVSAYGSSSVPSSGGGGLNGSVKSYSDALKLTSESMSEIASAYSIKQLSDRISNLDLKGDALSAITATTSGTGNALTSVSYDAATGKFTFTKGSTFLTAHQSLANYVNLNGDQTITGTKTFTKNIVSSGVTSTWVGSLTSSALTIKRHTGYGGIFCAPTKSGNIVVSTYPGSNDNLYFGYGETGRTDNSLRNTMHWDAANNIFYVGDKAVLTAHQSLANYYTKTDADKLLNAKSATSHTHSVKINGTTKTIAATGGTAVDLGTYLTSHQSLADYLKSADAAKTYLGISAKAADSDKLDGYHETSFFRGRAGTLTVAYADLAVYTKGAYDYKNPDNGIYSISRNGYSEGLIAFTNTTGSASGLDIIFNYARGSKLAIRRRIDSNRLSGDWESLITSVNIGSQSVASAAKWTTARNIGIVNSDGTGTAVVTSVNGSANVNLKLPSTIKASLTGNASTATKLATARTLWGNSFDGTANISGNLTGIGTDGNAKFNIKSVVATTDYIHIYVDGSSSTSRPLVLQNGYGNVGIGVLSPSEKLHIGGKINLNGLVLEYDSTNKALKVNGNIYATGGITAYGEGSASGSGGLNDSVLSYDKAVLETSENTTKLASAYSIARLKSLIDGIDGSALTEVDWSIIKNKPSTFTPSSHSHTFASLTSKPTTLSGYGITDGVNTVSVSGSGNAVTSASVSRHTLTLTKGTTFLTSHQSLADYAKQSWVNSRLFSRETVNANNVIGTGLHVYESENGSNMPTSNTWHQLVSWGTNDTDYVFQMANEYSCEGGLYIRQKIAGGWKAWRVVIDSSNIGSYVKSWINSRLFSRETVNANNVIGTGLHVYESENGSNMPTSNTWHQLVSWGTSDTDYVFQMANEYSCEGGLYIRQKIAGGWKAWRVVIDSSNIGSQSVSYATTAGSAKASDVYSWAKASTKPSYSWSEIGSRPTKLSQFTNDSGFITSSASITGNASTATKLATARTLWGQSFDGSNKVDGQMNINDLVNNNPIRIYGNTSECSIRYSCANGVSWIAGLSSGGGEFNIYCLSSLKFIKITGDKGDIYATGGITAYSSSDLRLKTNLHKADSLSLIKSLGSVYEFDYRKTNEHSFGLIAQNVQKSRLADLVANDDEGYLKLNYWSPKLISLALGGVVQVDDKVTRLRKKVAKLEKRIRELEVANTKLLENKKDKDINND